MRNPAIAGARHDESIEFSGSYDYAYGAIWTAWYRIGASFGPSLRMHADNVKSPTKLADLHIPGELVSVDMTGRRIFMAIYRVADIYLLLLRGDAGTVDVRTLSSIDRERESRKLIKQILAQCAPEPKSTAPNKTWINFWLMGDNGPESRARELEVPPWNEARRNYSFAAGEALDRLARFRADNTNGAKIIILHGPPGTGKTNVIRSIAREWQDWCRTEYIIDPDALFRSPSYMQKALLGDNRSDWRLVVAEDVEEFIVSDGKERVGQSLGRLLNVSDGLLGQGLKTMILLTTNVPITKVNPALTRPGRCLANIEVPKLSAAEASEWSDGKITKEATLAELYESLAPSLITAEAHMANGSGGVYL